MGLCCEKLGESGMALTYFQSVIHKFPESPWAQEAQTLLIPEFNEEAILENNLRSLAAHLAGLDHPFEIIVGSNGSFDKTLSILHTLEPAIPCLRFFHIPEKKVGHAFRRGIEMAQFNRIITVDMDLSIDLGFIESAFRLLSDHHVVVGSKISGDQKRSYVRKFASNAFIFCAKLLLGITHSDYSIAAKGYRKNTITGYLPYIDTQTFYVVQILFRAFHDGKRIVEIPVNCMDTRKSRFNLIHEGLYKFSRLFRLSIGERLLAKTHVFRSPTR
jgi:glycosyltransferase involved in cell wall biosynthesis